MDYRTFQDRSAKRTAAFSVQMGAMAVAYMHQENGEVLV